MHIEADSELTVGNRKTDRQLQNGYSNSDHGSDNGSRVRVANSIAILLVYMLALNHATSAHSTAFTMIMQAYVP